MTPAQLATAELRDAILRNSKDEITGEELAASLDVVIAAVREECFANSPVTAWIKSVPGNEVHCFQNENGDMMAILESPDGEDLVHGIGDLYLEQAFADALNKLEAKRGGE